MPRQPTTDQLDLFPKPQDGTLPPMPDWQALPDGTRQTLTRLMARLILNHVKGESASPRQEARHDA